MAAVIISSDFGTPKIKSATVSTVSLFAMKWWDWMPWSLFSECWAECFPNVEWKSWLKTQHSAPLYQLPSAKGTSLGRKLKGQRRKKKVWMRKLTSKSKHTVKLGKLSHKNMIPKLAITKWVKIQDIGNALEIMRPETYNSLHIKTSWYPQTKNLQHILTQ